MHEICVHFDWHVIVKLIVMLQSRLTWNVQAQEMCTESIPLLACFS